MSFSQDVKRELADCFPSAKHCAIAELAGIFSHIGRLFYENDRQYVEICSDNSKLVRKCFTLAEKSFNISRRADGDDRGFILNEPLMVTAFSEGLKLFGMDHDRELRCRPADERLIRHDCCKRAFLRGSFLAAGSMSNPKRSYHLEYVCSESACADQLQSVLSSLSFDCHIVQRKGKYVVYIKEGAGIVDLLGVMGAHRSLLELENLRILKEMRGSINRRVNCETANITKTITASSRQTDDIILIRDTIGLSKLPAALRDIAEARLEYPDVPLKELGECLDPPVGKSGVNHRFRKISDIAGRLRDGIPL